VSSILEPPNPRGFHGDESFKEHVDYMTRLYNRIKFRGGAWYLNNDITLYPTHPVFGFGPQVFDLVWDVESLDTEQMQVDENTFIIPENVFKIKIDYCAAMSRGTLDIFTRLGQINTIWGSGIPPSGMIEVLTVPTNGSATADFRYHYVHSTVVDVTPLDTFKFTWTGSLGTSGTGSLFGGKETWITIEVVE